MQPQIVSAILAAASISSVVAAPAPVYVNVAAPIAGAEGGHFYNGTTPSKRQSDMACITINSDITWYYTLTGVWGSTTGQGPSSGGLCVPYNDGAGGAFFFGPDPNPGAGSTKLECFFPTSGQSNCDVSLVDGYSLSMSCTTPDEPNTIGGGVDLYQTGTTCPDQQGANCINTQGYSGGGQGAVDAFFQPAVNDGNNYCIFNNCGQDYYFNLGDGLTCTVSGTAAA